MVTRSKDPLEVCALIFLVPTYDISCANWRWLVGLTLQVAADGVVEDARPCVHRPEWLMNEALIRFWRPAHRRVPAAQPLSMPSFER